MRTGSLLLLTLIAAAAGCKSVASHPEKMTAQNPDQASQAMSAIPPGRPVSSLNQVQVGDRISILQIVDKTDTWVTGQVDELSDKRLTLTQCQVEKRTYGEKNVTKGSTASRYSLPPGEVKAIRAM
jgi:hypothetical protein